MKINFEDEVQALLLLSSMPDSWNTLVVSVSNSAPDGKLTLEMVKNSMLNEERKVCALVSSTETESLQMHKLCCKNIRGKVFPRRENETYFVVEIGEYIRIVLLERKKFNLTNLKRNMQVHRDV
jgi:hypothetical protein